MIHSFFSEKFTKNLVSSGRTKLAFLRSKVDKDRGVERFASKEFHRFVCTFAVSLLLDESETLSLCHLTVGFQATHTHRPTSCCLRQCDEKGNN